MACQGKKPEKKYKVKNNDNFKVEEGQFTFDVEGQEDFSVNASRRVHVPSDESGLTIGRGLDFKKRSETEILKILTSAGMSEAVANIYKKGANKEGDIACTFLNSNKEDLKEITPAVQKKIFELLYPKYVAEMFHRSTKTDVVAKFGVLDWMHLKPEVTDLLVDLTYVGNHYDASARVHLLPILVNGEETTASDESESRPDNLKLTRFKETMADEEYWRNTRHKDTRPAKDRFKKRKEYADEITGTLYDDSNSLGYAERFVFELEDSNLTAKLYDFNKEDAFYGIGIGRGFTLGNRRIFREQPDYQYPPKGRNQSNEEYEAIKEAFLLKLKGEVRNYLVYADIKGDSLEAFVGAVGKTGVRAKRHLDTNKDKLKINPDQEKKLFEVMIFQAMADLYRVTSGKLRIEKDGPIHWPSLNKKIQAILLDMAYTDQYCTRDTRDNRYADLRNKLHPHLIKNDGKGDIEDFTKALKKWKEWELFNNSETRNLWENRFNKRIELLESNVNNEECQPGELWCASDLNAPFIHQLPPEIPFLEDKNKKIPFPLPILEPGCAAVPIFEFSSEEGKEVLTGHATDLIKTSNIIPEMMKMRRELVTKGKELAITDLYFPALNRSLEIADFSEEEGIVDGTPRPTKTINVAFPGEEYKKIRKGMRVRLERKERNDDFDDSMFQYIYIVKDPINGKLELAEEIDLSQLGSPYFQVDTTFFLPLNTIDLAGLLGDKLPGIDIMVSSPMGKLDIRKFRQQNSGGINQLPIMADIFFPKLDKNKTKAEYQHLSLQMNLILKRIGVDWRLENTKLFLNFPESKEQIYEFEVFSIVFPKCNEKDRPSEGKYDVSIDLRSREVIFSSDSDVAPKLYFPGGFKDEIKAADGDSTKIQEAKNKRFLCEFEKQNIDPDDHSKGNFFLKLNKSGISFEAKVTKKEVNLPLKDDSSVQMTPRERDGKQFEGKFLIRDNNIEAASISSTVNVPGFKDLRVDVKVSIRKENPNKPPIIIAEIELENRNSLPLAQLNLELLQMKLMALRLKLAWDLNGNKWDFSAIADGTISFTDAARISPNLVGLKNLSAITVEELDLLKLHLKDVNIGFQLKKDIEFDILDGLFGFSLRKVRLNFNSTGGVFIYSKAASVSFNQPGTLEIIVETKSASKGQDALEIGVTGSPELRILQPFGITVRLGPNITFRGSLGLINDNKNAERYFFAEGEASIEGLPSFKGLLKIGTVRKHNGEKAPSVVLYGAQDIDVQLYPGVVVKNMGCGIGCNNRLVGIDANPNEAEILEKIDQITPERYTAWSGVQENGFYLSIVASAVLASNQGSTREINAYVAELILSLDTDLNVAAAGRLWLSSSVDFALRNRTNPALIGALALSVKDKRIGVRLETRPNPKIEENEWLKSILNATRARLSFRLTPELVDYYLEELSFQKNFLGIDMRYIANYRFAIFNRAVLLKTSQNVTGRYHNSLKSGVGGIGFDGDIAIGFGYAGLLSSKGLVAYGQIHALLPFYLKAYIDIGFSKTIKVWKWKKTIRWLVRFSANMNADIQLSGRAAIIESGRFGFEGVAGVSVSICGYGLSIHGRIDVSPGIVNQAVNRVVAFEHKLNTIEEKTRLQLHPLYKEPTSALLNAKFKKGNSFLLDQSEKEVWLHYYNPLTKYHLIVPAENTTWYTPQYKVKGKTGELINHVTSLYVGNNVYKFLWTNTDTENEQLQNAIGFFLETASEKDYSSIDRQPYSVVKDPRVESDEREYLSHKDRTLPDYALSYEFRDSSELLSNSSASRDEIKKIHKYEESRQRFGQMQTHSIDNEDEYEASKQNRARVVKTLIDDLNHPDGPQLFGQYVENNKKIGVFFKQDVIEVMELIKSGGISVQRGDKKTPIECISVETRSSETDYSDFIFPLPIRQKFFEAESGRNKEEFSKIVVKLPIDIEKLIEGGKLPEVSHYQIFRNFPDQEPSLIADFVRPNTAVLNSPEMKIGLQLKRKFNHQAGVEEDYLETTPLTESTLSYLREIDLKNCMLVSDGKEKIFIPVNELEETKTRTLHLKTKAQFNFLSNTSIPAMLLVNTEKLMIVDPYLYTDEYYVKNGGIYIKQERDGRQWYDKTSIIADFSEIHYSLKVVPFNVEKGDEKKQIIPYRVPLKLHIPKPFYFPENLAIVFSVGSLILEEKNNGHFQFINSETKRPEFIDVDAIDIYGVLSRKTHLRVNIKTMP